jgi:hypothetical protein
MLAKNKGLRKLNLAKHRIRDDAMEWLVQGLAQNTTLKVLNLRAYVLSFWLQTLFLFFQWEVLTVFADLVGITATKLVQAAPSFSPIS